MKKQLYLLSLIILFSCSNKNKNGELPIYGIWTLSETEKLKDKKSNSGDKLLDESLKIVDAKKNITLSIFPDNTYTKLCCNGDSYEFGTWKWLKIGERICFMNKGKQEVSELKIKLLDDSVHQVEFKNAKVISRFERQEKLLDNYKEEPFYCSNNEWRIKAIKVEKRQELINRLGNYFKHMAYILKAADKRDLSVVSFKYSMGIIKIYNSGIGIEEDMYIPENWKNIFYDTKQYMETRSIFNNYLSSQDLSFPSSNDWVKDDYRIMLSIYNDLKTGKF